MTNLKSGCGEFCQFSCTCPILSIKPKKLQRGQAQAQQQTSASNWHKVQAMLTGRFPKICHIFYLYAYILFSQNKVHFVLLHWWKKQQHRKDDVEVVELVPELSFCSSSEDSSHEFCHLVGCWRPLCSVHHSLCCQKTTSTISL